MMHNDIDMKNWKNELLDYYKKYLTSFEEGSKEHSLLKRTIREFEKTQ